jgi:hypothetical protein
MVSLGTIEVMIGIFTTFALIIGSVLLKKYEQPWFTWLLLSFIAFFLTLYAYFAHALQTPAPKFFMTAMILFALVALWHFWDIMSFTK